MITISDEETYVYVLVTAEFALQDFKVLEDELRYRVTPHAKINLLFDVREMLNCTIDVAIEELRFARNHAKEFGRVAVVSHDQMVSWNAWLSALLSDAEMRNFDSVEDARAWILGVPDVELGSI